jgi:hypothetical protein
VQILEIHFEQGNVANRQHRIIEHESWQVYCESINLCEGDSFRPYFIILNMKVCNDTKSMIIELINPKVNNTSTWIHYATAIPDEEE